MFPFTASKDFASKDKAVISANPSKSNSYIPVYPIIIGLVELFK